MEITNKNQELSPKSLENSLKKSSVIILKTANGDQLTANGIAVGISLIKKAFPTLPIDFYDILTDMIIEERFYDEKFIETVKHVIKTCEYPTPTIAQFINYNKDNLNARKLNFVQ